MSFSLDDIWDVPVEDTPAHSRKDALATAGNTPVGPSPAKRRRTALFLSSDSENDAPAIPYKRRTPPPSEKDKHNAAVDALFDDLDGLDDAGAVQDLAPSLNIDQLRKQAEARQKNKVPAMTPHQILPSSSPPRDIGPDEDAEDGPTKREKGKKGEGLHKRKPLPKLDETRLMGKDGFPALVKQVKDFKPKGKGHELSDLSHVLNIYQFWTHKMFPKGTFQDNVQRVEKLCHSKRMHNALGMLRDEAKGTINGRKPEELEPLEDPSDNSDSDVAKEPADVRLTSEAPRTRSSSPATRPPSSASERPSLTVDDDDFDIDAMIREDEERQAPEVPPTFAPISAVPATSSSSAPAPPLSPPDEDQEMWDQFGEMEDPLDETVVQPQLPAVTAMAVDADDDDAWDALRDMESNNSVPSERAPILPSTPAVPHDPPAAPVELAEVQASLPTTASHDGHIPTNDEGWEEMYL